MKVWFEVCTPSRAHTRIACPIQLACMQRTLCVGIYNGRKKLKVSLGSSLSAMSDAKRSTTLTASFVLKIHQHA